MSGGLALEARGIRKAFRKSGFVLDVDAIDVPAGGTLALLGPSGSGKSTLLTMLGLLERPDAGTVLVDGRAATPNDRAVRLKMAAVFQRPYLFKGSVGANVAYGLSVRGVPAEERAHKVASILERVGLSGYENRSALSLSGGEAQRVSFARALVLEPKALLLDEPLASLDPLLKRRLVEDFVGILADEALTVVWVTHDQDEALAVGQRIAIMDQGRIVQCGPADEVVSLAADEWTASFLGIEQAAEGTVAQAHEGLISVQLDSGGVVFATGEAHAGLRVMVAVRPEDVLLFEATEALPATTARNRVSARVVSVARRGTVDRVVLDVDGLRLASTVSRASAAELGLAKGGSVLAVFKASAVRWRPI